MLHDTILGEGQLEDWDHPAQKIQVAYKFEITEVLAAARFPSVATRRHSTGTISALNGEPVLEGYYRLYAHDGEILKVKNLGFSWVILAS
jgi:hypothetical protein